ncbi:MULTISPECIES: TetR/AcrR family transcriptional regulator [unclassified Gordonia (in: high G+C Gram-positive bacteria)]
MAPQTQKLTTSAIVDSAIAIADRDGLDALSMRRIADDLGVGAMSLYRHVADKDALLAAMAAEVGRRFPYPVEMDPAPTWRERIAIAADIDWQLYQRHPWVVLAYSVPRYGFGDDSLEGLEWLADGFGQLGVEPARAVEMVLTFWSYVNGVALVGVSEQILRADGAATDPGGGLGDLLRGWTERDDDDRLASLPIVSSVAAHTDVGRLLSPRAILDSGVAYLCAGFAASSGR